MFALVASGLATVLDLFVMFIGARFLMQPLAAATGYGVPSPPSAYLNIKGLRDLTSGVIGLAVLAFAGAHAAGWAMLAVALTPLGDTLIVLRHDGTKAAAYGIHFATAVAVLFSAVLLFLA